MIDGSRALARKPMKNRTTCATAVLVLDPVTVIAVPPLLMKSITKSTKSTIFDNEGLQRDVSGNLISQAHLLFLDRFVTRKDRSLASDDLCAIVHLAMEAGAGEVMIACLDVNRKQRRLMLMVGCLWGCIFASWSLQIARLFFPF